MKTVVNRITLHFICIVIFPLCLLALSGCAGLDSEYIEIVSPADISSFESGDSITFEMRLTVNSRASAFIKKGTIIQWTSDRDGDFWREEVDHDIKGVETGSGAEYTASYSQSFSTSALSAADHKITCKADYDTINIATKSIRIYISESQNTTTTTIAATTTTATDTTTIAPADQRYMDNGNGTVTDKRTNLIWLKNGSTCGTKNWEEAVAYCSSLASGMAGLTDGSSAGQWRLPSVEELEGIGTDPPTTYCLDGSCNYPSVSWTFPGAPFTGLQDSYWSGTSTADTIGGVWGEAWGMSSLSYGKVENFSKDSELNVWAVRGGN
jgi:hypothetical protein